MLTSEQTSTALGQAINLQGKFAHVLQLWRKTYLPEPLIALREYISNAFDASLNDPNAAIWIDIEQNAIVISDEGLGMDRETLVSNFSIFNEKSSNRKNGKLGEFGLGRLSAFAIAEKIEIITRHQSQLQAWKLIWIEGKSHMLLSETQSRHKGTKVKLHLKPNLVHLAKSKLLQSYINRTFSLLRKPIYISDHGKALNPINRFVDSSVRRAEKIEKSQQVLCQKPEAQQLFATYYPEHRALISYVQTETDGSQVYLGISYQNELDENNGAQVFKKGVWVCETKDNFLPAPFSFIKVLINNPHLKLSATRNHLLPDDPSVHEMPAYLNKQLFSFFTLLANEQPQILQKVLNQHRDAILSYAVNRLHWQDFLAKHYRFCGLTGLLTWYEIVDKLKSKSQHPRLALVNTTAELTPEFDAAIISNEDTEREFVRLLATDTEIWVEEPDQNDPEIKENVALRLYCVSLLQTAITQLQHLGTEEAQLAYFRQMCLQLQTKLD